MAEAMPDATPSASPGPSTAKAKVSARAPRESGARRAVLEAALALVLERGYAAVTTAEIAARAGAGKQTIYRWWPGKAVLVLDALDGAGALPATEGTPLPAFLAELCRRLSRTAPALRSLMAEAQSDGALRVIVRRRLVEPRRAALAAQLAGIGLAAGPARDIAVEAIDGALWGRLLLGDPLDEAFVDGLVCLAEAAAT
jgi:AcrR family transcriptional regulator